MCSRYALDEGFLPEAWKASLSALRIREPAMKTSGEALPTDVVPVIANSRAMHPRLFAMKWGYTLPDGRVLINARSETAAQKPLFAQSMRCRRCLIPASRYFEWDKRARETVKYAVGDAGAPRFYLAGLYRLEEDQPVFTILTRSPADSIAFLHDRMPVILPPSLAADWLSPDCPADAVLSQAVTDVDFCACSPETLSFLPPVGQA